MNKRKPAIVMQTDFTKDISVCTMQGVCAMIDPDITVYDCTHEIPSFNTYVASTSLSYVVDFWPVGTIFVSVVDPGVGTDRRACVARLKNGSYVVTPDNGTLTHVHRYIGVEEVRIIDETRNRLETTKKCSIFHGRDLFSYCAAKLAAGLISYEEVGEAYSIEELVLHPMVEPVITETYASGIIEAADLHFGLICSNIPCEAFEQMNLDFGDKVTLKISDTLFDIIAFEETVPYQPSFGSVPIGAPLLMVSETLQVQSAINNKNMTELYNISCGSNWKFEIIKETK